jgi:hypothetical protein
VKPVISQQHFCQRLVVGERHAARVAAGIGLFHQLQIAYDVLVIERVTMKFLQQIECDVRLMLHQRIADYIQLVVKTDGINVVAHLLES